MDVHPGDYAQWVFGLLQSTMSFDSGGRSCLDTRSGHTLVMGSDLYREDPAMLGEWQAINGADPVLGRGLSQPARATAFHAPTIMASLRDAGMRHYLKHNAHHRNGLVIISPSAVGGQWDALGFYRAEGDRQFTRGDMRRLDQLAPHVLQAIKINLRLAGAVEQASGAAPAIVRPNGALQYAAPALPALLRLEWPDWHGHAVPSALMTALRSSHARRFTGKHIAVTADVTGNLIVLRVTMLPTLASLSDREAIAARLYGAGLSTKDIARRMEIAPNTVRNFIQRVYRKLDVNDKAALATLLGADAAG